MNHQLNAIVIVDVNPFSPDYDTVVSTLETGDDPFFQTLSPDGNWLFVANNADGTLSKLDVSGYR